MHAVSVVSTGHYWYAKGYKLIVIMHEMKASEINFSTKSILVHRRIHYT